ncbi:hypothetical protein WJM95_32945 [Streptomyces sp. f51]|uniref:hypothetical protein n=1 Tax=Streptomyces sp. f51 TaxID=1827742 RepID=UPI0030CBA09D
MTSISRAITLDAAAAVHARVLRTRLRMMVPACLVAAPALGAAAAGAASALGRHRMGSMAHYAVWIATATVSVFLLPTPILRASPTCRPVVP